MQMPEPPRNIAAENKNPGVSAGVSDSIA